MTIYVQNGRLYCDFDMYAGKSRHWIVVRHNRIAAPLPLGWDANSNGNGLEVVDEKWRPMFQMYSVHPNEVVINGVFRTEDHFFLQGTSAAVGAEDRIRRSTT